MSMTALSHDAANPLDIMEQIISANDWACDRRSDSHLKRGDPLKQVLHLRLCSLLPSAGFGGQLGHCIELFAPDQL